MNATLNKPDNIILLTIEQAAEAANCPVSAIRRLIGKGILPVVQLTRKCARISHDDLLDVLEHQRLVRGGSKDNAN